MALEFFRAAPYRERKRSKDHGAAFGRTRRRRTAGGATKRSRGTGAVLTVLLAAVLLPAGSGCSGADEPGRVAASFLAAWCELDYEAMYALLDEPSRDKYEKDYFINRYTAIGKGIGLRTVQAEPGEKIESSGDRVSFSFTATLDTNTVGPIPIENTLALTRADRGSPWLVEWHPGLIFPELTGDRRVDVQRAAPRRGTIYDRHGRILAGLRTFTEVGAVPGRYANEEEFVRAVAALLEISPSLIKSRLSQGWVKEGLYVPLALLPPERESLANELLLIEGVMLNHVERRYYPAGAAAAHVTGYLGEISAEELEEKKKYGYNAGDLVGKAGLEAALDELLGGSFGFTLRILEADGSEAAIIAAREGHPGEDIHLTLDYDLQLAAAAALGNKAGAVAALDLASGEVLALVSNPAYDPNEFIAGLTAERWQALQNNPDRPFLDRALLALYPPGSAFKPFTAAAALDTQSLDPAERVRIEGESWQPGPSWGEYKVKRVYSERTSLNLDEAMKYSDNIYFARVGLSLGVNLFEQYGERFGFGEKLLFPLPVAVSRLSRSGIGSEILLADSSYGQGEVLITPLQMTLLYCPFAGGSGAIPLPRLLLSGEPGPAAWKEDAVSPAAAARVHRSLVEAVHGAGAPARNGIVPGYTVAGKTGTAQVNPAAGNICWYVTYGPAEQPALVVATVVEEGEWAGEEALPVGRAVLEYFLAKEYGG